MSGTLADIFSSQLFQKHDYPGLRFEEACASMTDSLFRANGMYARLYRGAHPGPHVPHAEIDQMMQLLVKEPISDITGRAEYHPHEDIISLPFKGIKGPSMYYLMALHELVHWSGHKSRLSRQSSLNYDQMVHHEEFIAEFGSLVLFRFFGLHDERLEDGTANTARRYLDNVVASADPSIANAIVHHLISESIKAVAFILNQARLID